MAAGGGGYGDADPPSDPCYRARPLTAPAGGERIENARSGRLRAGAPDRGLPHPQRRCSLPLRDWVLKISGAPTSAASGAIGIHAARLVGVGDQIDRLAGLQERPHGGTVARGGAAVGDQEIERRRQLRRLAEIVDDPGREAAAWAASASQRLKASWCCGRQGRSPGRARGRPGRRARRRRSRARGTGRAAARGSAAGRGGGRRASAGRASRSGCDRAPLAGSSRASGRQFSHKPAAMWHKVATPRSRSRCRRSRELPNSSSATTSAGRTRSKGAVSCRSRRRSSKLGRQPAAWAGRLPPGTTPPRRRSRPASRPARKRPGAAAHVQERRRCGKADLSRAWVFQRENSSSLPAWRRRPDACHRLGPEGVLPTPTMLRYY